MDVQEKLIELVREQPIIYDTTQINYSNIIKKSKAWDTIALQCNLNTGEEAKKLWMKLRDAYWSSLKRTETRSGDCGSSTKPWKFQDQMSFLLPYMKDRKRCTNEEVPQLMNEDDMAENALVTEGHTDEFGHNADSSYNESCNESVRPSKKNKIDLSSVLVDLSKGREERRRNREEFRRQITQPPDDLKLFFDSMYESTKKLSPSLQRMVKRRLFAIVSEAEDIEEKNTEPSQKLQSSETASISPNERSPSQSSNSSGSHMFTNEYFQL